MRPLLLLLLFIGAGNILEAQYVYTINADSVKITNHCDTAELILENHTQNVPGFLYNKGRGRTEFRQALQKLNATTYLVGGDTLFTQPYAWAQGGNAFGTTGKLGTLDNNHLDFYTRDSLRGRLTKTGHWLIGDSADNGNLLQVYGPASFSGNVNIGSATITPTGSLIGTNAILFNHFISEYHNYQGNSPYISKLDNVLYNYALRFNTTTTTGADGSINIDIIIPDDEIVPGYNGIVYPGGNMYFSFWNNGIAQSVTVLMKTYTGAWVGPYSSGTNIGYGGAGFIQVPIPASFNYATEIKITIAPAPGGFINLQNVEYVLDAGPQGLVNGLPFVGKYTNEHMYNLLYFKNAGQDNVRISPFAAYPNYFLTSVLVGATTASGNAKLQVTGDVTATGNLGIGTSAPAAQLHTTGSVRFAGLTNDSTQTRVLVSDANGSLYYRNLSSWASNGTFNSSLAVKGILSAQQVKIMPAGWADYVFNGNYRLPLLADVEKYIKQNKHLPGIPAASEVQQKGIDVGESQAALLKKIEELTLYVIDQDKKLQAQNEKLSKQDQAMDAMQKKIDELIKRIEK